MSFRMGYSRLESTPMVKIPVEVVFCMSPRSGAKLKNVVGEMHNPNLPTNRLRSSPICQHIGLALSFNSKTTLTSIIDI